MGLEAGSGGINKYRVFTVDKTVQGSHMQRLQNRAKMELQGSWMFGTAGKKKPVKGEEKVCLDGTGWAGGRSKVVGEYATTWKPQALKWDPLTSNPGATAYRTWNPKQSQTFSTLPFPSLENNNTAHSFLMGSTWQDVLTILSVARWIECWPANQMVLVRFPVRAHA